MSDSDELHASSDEVFCVREENRHPRGRYEHYGADSWCRNCAYAQEYITELEGETRRIWELETDLASAKQTLAGVQCELADSRRELSESQSELTGIKQQLADAQRELTDVKQTVEQAFASFKATLGEWRHDTAVIRTAVTHTGVRTDPSVPQFYTDPSKQ